MKFEEDRAFRRSRELKYLDQPDPQEPLSQSQGSSGQGLGGSRGTSITMSGPSVSSGSQSQRGGALGSMQSSSLWSPLMDSSHGTQRLQVQVQAGGQQTNIQEFRLLMRRSS